MGRGRAGVVRRWRQWTASEAGAALAELEATGESTARFARRKGISTRRVEYWKKRLRGAGDTDFVPVALPAASPAGIEIATSGVVIRVREDLDVEHVARLVEAIGRRTGREC